MDDINVAIKGVIDAMNNLFAHIVRLSSENIALRQELALRRTHEGDQFRTTGAFIPAMSRQMHADIPQPVAPSIYGIPNQVPSWDLLSTPSYTGSAQLYSNDPATRIASLEYTLNDLQKRVERMPVRTLDKLTPTQIVKLGLRPGQTAELSDTIPQLNDKLKLLFLQAGIADETLQRQLLACYPVHFAAKAQ